MSSDIALLQLMDDLSFLGTVVRYFLLFLLVLFLVL